MSSVYTYPELMLIRQHNEKKVVSVLLSFCYIFFICMNIDNRVK